MRSLTGTAQEVATQALEYVYSMARDMRAAKGVRPYFVEEWIWATASEVPPSFLSMPACHEIEDAPGGREVLAVVPEQQTGLGGASRCRRTAIGQSSFPLQTTAGSIRKNYRIPGNAAPALSSYCDHACHRLSTPKPHAGCSPSFGPYSFYRAFISSSKTKKKTRIPWWFLLTVVSAGAAAPSGPTIDPRADADAAQAAVLVGHDQQHR